MSTILLLAVSRTAACGAHILLYNARAAPTHSLAIFCPPRYADCCYCDRSSRPRSIWLADHAYVIPLTRLLACCYVLTDRQRDCQMQVGLTVNVSYLIVISGGVRGGEPAPPLPLGDGPTLCAWPKKDGDSARDNHVLALTLPNIHRLSNKPFLMWLLTTPPHFKYVATLPSNLSLTDCFAGNNVLQGSVATYATCGEIF